MVTHARNLESPSATALPESFNALTILPELCPSCKQENSAKVLTFTGTETIKERETLERRARICQHCGQDLYEAGRQALGI